jgi:four helix bundle protein
MSIPTNIAEGCGRGNDAELVRFLWIAQGSATELEYQILLCRDLRLIDESTYVNLDEKAREVQRMLNSLIQTLSKSPNRHSAPKRQAATRLKTED